MADQQATLTRGRRQADEELSDIEDTDLGRQSSDDACGVGPVPSCCQSKGVRAAGLLALVALGCVVALSLRDGERPTPQSQPREALSVRGAADSPEGGGGAAPPDAPYGGLRATTLPPEAYEPVLSASRGASAVPSDVKNRADYWDEIAGTRGAGGALAPGGGTRGGGSECRDDEELLKDGLCYKKCSILTDARYPIRTSAFTCCKSHPCHLLNQVHDFGICSGFDVAGGSRKTCPHKKGTCLGNEELYLGQCYKKCSLLEPGFPNRVTALTCCKTWGVWCFNPFKSRTHTRYNVGGGGDDEDPSTPAGAHFPIGAPTGPQQHAG